MSEEKKEEKKPEPKKVTAKKAEKPAKKPKRQLHSFNAAAGRAIVSENGKKLKVFYYPTRGGSDPTIGVAGGKGVPLSQWLEGKADL